jgi:hypothetical protein
MNSVHAHCREKWRQCEQNRSNQYDGENIAMAKDRDAGKRHCDENGIDGRLRPLSERPQL